MGQKILAGNWKMNLTLPQAEALTSEIVQILKTEGSSNVPIVLCPPALYLTRVQHLIKDSANVFLGAQNVFYEPSGAFTGEISAPMLKSVGCAFAIVGHSERRNYFGETNEKVLQKVQALIQADIHPILCIGEVQWQRESGITLQIIEEQLRDSLFAVPEADVAKVIIAYEPVWAIGTGLTATPDQAQEVHAFIREQLTKQYGTTIASAMTILYGGSVKADNAKGLFSQPDVDGALVGGASLNSREFVGIYQALGS
jgi:triosephosphate isomerase